MRHQRKFSPRKYYKNLNQTHDTLFFMTFSYFLFEFSVQLEKSNAKPWPLLCRNLSLKLKLEIETRKLGMKLTLNLFLDEPFFEALLKLSEYIFEPFRFTINKLRFVKINSKIYYLKFKSQKYII